MSMMELTENCGMWAKACGILVLLAAVGTTGRAFEKHVEGQRLTEYDRSNRALLILMQRKVRFARNYGNRSVDASPPRLSGTKVVFIVNLLDPGGEFAVRELCTHALAGVELGRLLDQISFVIKDQGIAAGQNCRRRECCQTAMHLLPAGTLAQQEGHRSRTHGGTEAVEFAPVRGQQSRNGSIQLGCLPIKLTPHDARPHSQIMATEAGFERVEAVKMTPQKARL